MSDNSIVQSFINSGHVPPETYNIDTSQPLTVPSGTNLQIDGTLIATPNNLPVSAIMELNGVHDVMITGGTFVGDIAAHSDSGQGRAGGLISILNSTNVTLSGAQCHLGWADGIYLQGNTNVHVAGVACIPAVVMGCPSYRAKA